MRQQHQPGLKPGSLRSTTAVCTTALEVSMYVRQTDIQADRQTDIQADRQIERQTDRQNDRKTDMQTDKHTDRQND